MTTCTAPPRATPKIPERDILEKNIVEIYIIERDMTNHSHVKDRKYHVGGMLDGV